ncbi:hypothetical protein [Elizabethkingia anophelis]|uniref:hypothetical protein n=1 Tax=Elizabethkingia anophelis TaxID=1117645 RepID=UPI0021A6318E|nr:hypothetical protein [Elizabethkingia anophelis]
MNDFNYLKRLGTDYRPCYRLANKMEDLYKEAKTGKVKMKFVDESGKPVTPNFNELTKQKQFTIRKNNYPIELSEAIKYPGN